MEQNRHLLSQDIVRYNALLGRIDKLPSGDESNELRRIAEKIKTELLAADAAMQKNKSPAVIIDRINVLFDRLKDSTQKENSPE